MDSLVRATRSSVIPAKLDENGHVMPLEEA
jgi:hypothetical protein